MSAERGFDYEPEGFVPEGRYRTIRYNRDFGVVTEQWSPSIEDVLARVREQLVLAEQHQSVSVDVFA